MIHLFKKIYNKLSYYFYKFINKILISLRIYPKVISSHDSIKGILDKKMSVSRFGCGELSVMRGNDWGFQNYDKLLIKRLKEVLKSDNEFIAICIPDVFDNRSRLANNASKFWDREVRENLYHWNKYTVEGKTYYDSLFTRFYMDLEDKKDFPKKSLELIKKLWDNEDVLIVEGKGTRLGYNNDLFDNVKSIQRILCPAENAFSSYNEILEATKKNAPGKLILVALGMTATVLSYDLAINGFRAIDIGHVDLEYEWYKIQATKKQPILYRYSNELNCREVDEINDKTYLKQIIQTI